MMRLRSSIRLLALCAATGACAAPAFATERPPSQEAVTGKSATAPSVPTQSIVPEHLNAATFNAKLIQRPIPGLLVTGKPAVQNVSAFLERVSVSPVSERERVRELIHQASGNAEISSAVATEAFNSRTVDFTRSLTALSVLGELRNPTGEAALTKFIALPLPTQGHMVEGEIAERVTLEELQMKAVDGLAYARTATADKEVLRNARENPSRAVRAEAIEAYLFNHDYSDQARKELAAVVQPGERVFLDRPHLMPATSGADFNAQLERFLALHPELKAPQPVRKLQARLPITSTSADKLKEAAQKAQVRRPASPPQF